MRENRATVRVVNSWLVVASYLSERTSTHPTSQGTIQVCCFMFQLCFLEFDGSLSGGTEGPMAYVKMLYWCGRLWASRSLQRSLQTRLFVVAPHSMYFNCTHYLRTESWRASRMERVGRPRQDRSSLSAGHKGPCCLCGRPWVSVLVWRRRRISAVSLLHPRSSSFRCCGDLRRGILTRC